MGCGYDDSVDFQNSGSRYRGGTHQSGAQTFRQGRSGISGQSGRADYRIDLDYPICKSVVSGYQCIV